MRVVDHEPGAWFLLDADGELLLDVNCSHSVASYAVVIALEEHERRAHQVGGHAYLDQLAQAIQDSAPGIARTSSPYAERNIAAHHTDAITAAVAAWRADDR